jgi:hypothetical protein
MRIELPAASWADAAHRADDDAHTLTLVSPASPSEWGALPTMAAPADAMLTLRAQVSTDDAVTLTLTL